MMILAASRATLAALVLALALSAPAIAAQAINTNGSNFAIGGYDPVAYFTDGKAIRGAKSYTHEWGGKPWRFRSEANRDTFAAAPEKYAPAYGGYCAYGVAEGYKVRIDPRAFTIVDGRLYLNYSKGIKKRFDSDRPGYIAKADANWPALSRQ